MARYPGAVWKPITADKLYGPGLRPSLNTYNRVNLHSTASGASSQFSYFNQSGIPDSHFHVAYDGTVEQYVDTSMQAFADLDGNDATVSIETQGVTENTGDEKWRPAQVAAIIALTAWIMRTHGMRRQLADTAFAGSVSSQGLSWHRLGCDGNFPSLPSIQAGRLQRGGGMHYSAKLGKVCPGYLRITQIHQEIWPGVQAALGAAPTTGGFLMALTNEQQDLMYERVRETRIIVEQCRTKLERIEETLETNHNASFGRETEMLSALAEVKTIVEAL